MSPDPGSSRRTATESLAALASLVERIGRSANLDEALTVGLDALAELFGFEHSMLLMLDENRTALYTIASRGYDREGIGSEVAVGQGVIGQAAADGRAVRINNLQRLLLYARSAQQTAESPARPGTEVPLPDLPAARSQLAAPAYVMGQIAGVLVVESDRHGAFSKDDEHLLTTVAHLIGNAIDLDRVEGPVTAAPAVSSASDRVSFVRFFSSDGSTFVDGDYLVKGVPGRILWRLVGDYVNEARTDFTNREVRLDPRLELPPFRDNLESRLTLLKRRLDEREAPMRIHKTGRGRFRLEVEGALRLELGDA
ncbi:MAG: GAF domain-containing protein [Acidimicrobiia bacterium]|nr:GAF domain-containing protein [Acidimicrobiia bacterium]